MNEIYCDDCKQDFEPDMKEQEIEKGIVEQYFCCPHCGKKFTIIITDENMRRKIRKRQRIQKEYKRAVRNRDSEFHLRMIQRRDEALKHELLEMSAETKRKWG